MPWASSFGNSRKTERGAKQFLARTVVRAAPFALLGNSRATETVASVFLFISRTAPVPVRCGELAQNGARREAVLGP
jgi:hypothetical protein